MQYKSALAGLSSVHALSILHGDLSSADSVSSSLVITEPSDDVVFVDFALGACNFPDSFGFQSEISFLHALFLWHCKSNDKGLLDWADNNVRKELHSKRVRSEGAHFWPNIYYTLLLNFQNIS
jgi:hypothetical protein